MSTKKIVISTKKITSIAMLSAIAIIFNLYTIITGVKYFAISFTYIPAFVAGAFLGPFSGFAVGFFGDLIAGFIHPFGPYNPIIGIASGLLGFIPGIIFKFIKGNDYFRLVLSAILCLIICTAGLNTYALYIMYSHGKTFWAYLILRLPFQFAILGINLMAMIVIWKPLLFLTTKYTIK